LDHVKYFRSNAFQNSAKHQQLEIKGFVLARKNSKAKLPETKQDRSCPEKFICHFFVAKPQRNDKDYWESAGKGVEEIECGDIDLEYAFQWFLESLGLVENKVMAEHHKDEQDSQLHPLH